MYSASHRLLELSDHNQHVIAYKASLFIAFLACLGQQTMNVRKDVSAVPGCCCVHIIAKTAQDCAKEGILLEAVAPTRLPNQLFKDFAQVRSDELFVLQRLQFEQLLSAYSHNPFQSLDRRY